MAQRQLLDAPFEVILTICCFLELKDVLAFEQTSRKVRDVVAERQVWLNLLKRLDQCCAPDIPPHIDLDSLSTLELRDRIVTAVRIYENCLRGEAQYVRRTGMVLESPGLVGVVLQTLDEVQLAPGGRYLFVQLSDTVMQIYDLRRNNVCVWSYTHQIKRARRHERSSYAFEMLRDGSITLFLSLKDVNELEEWSFQVHRLFPSKRDVQELQSTLVYSSPTFPRSFVRVKLVGKFALVQRGKSGLIVTNWNDGWYIELSCHAEAPSSCIWETNVLQDTIFVLACINVHTSRWSIIAVPFHELCSIYGSQGSGCTLSLGDPRFSSSSFEFTSWHGATLFTQPFREKGVLIALIGEGHDSNHIARYEFHYDPNAATQSALVLLGSKKDTASGTFINFGFGGCCMTRTKCGFRQLDKPEILVKFGYKPDGGFFESILMPTEYFQGISFHPEEYSSALVLMRNNDSETIEIWYPEYMA